MRPDLSGGAWTVTELLGTGARRGDVRERALTLPGWPCTPKGPVPWRVSRAFCRSSLAVILLGLPRGTEAAPGSDGVCAARDPVSPMTAWQASARGLSNLQQENVAAAIRCLETAHRGLPQSEVIARDLAVALSRAGKTERALALLDVAKALGDPEGDIEKAVLAARLGDAALARSAARRVSGSEGDILGAVLGDPDALRDLGRRLTQGTELAPLARLVLAGEAAEEGRLGPAVAMSRAAELGAERLSDALVFNAARTLQRRIRRSSSPATSFRARVGAEQIINPQWALPAPSRIDEALSVRSELQLALASRLGSLTWSGAVSVDQRIFLSDREALASVERFGVTAAMVLAVPFSADLRSAVFNVGLRVVDVRAEGFALRLGTGLEGGGGLRISLAPRWWGELGVYGVWTDFPEPTDRAFDRDRVGQRARLSLVHRGQRFDAEMVMTALHDETEGQAFDAVGAIVGGTVTARLSGSASLRAGLSVGVRQWGPAGDEALVGEAARRRDVRITAELEGRLRVAPRVVLLARDVFVRSAGPTGRVYAGNLLTLGTEVAW